MKKFLFILFVIASLFIVNNLVRSIYTIWQKKDLVIEAEKELFFQKQENQRLKSQLSYSKTSEFVEKKARDELFMVKPGEEKVIGESVFEEGKKQQNEKKIEKPNWRKWLELFF